MADESDVEACHGLMRRTVQGGIEIPIEDLKKFIANYFTHEDVDALMEERGVDKAKYKSNHLSVPYVAEGIQRIHLTERELARRATSGGYEFVSNLEQASFSLNARAWKKAR